MRNNWYRNTVSVSNATWLEPASLTRNRSPSSSYTLMQTSVLGYEGVEIDALVNKAADLLQPAGPQIAHFTCSLQHQEQ